MEDLSLGFYLDILGFLLGFLVLWGWQASVAYIPLLVYGSGLIASIVMKYVTERIGKKIVFVIGCAFGIAASIWIQSDKTHLFKDYFIYAASVFLGIGTSTMLVTALGLVNDMIGPDVKSSAFVFGVMSFLDKFSNGAAIMIIQTLHPKLNHPEENAAYYRLVLGFVCGSAFLCAFFSLLTLYHVKFNTTVLTGNKNQKFNPEKSISSSRAIL